METDMAASGKAITLAGEGNMPDVVLKPGTVPTWVETGSVMARNADGVLTTTSARVVFVVIETEPQGSVDTICATRMWVDCGDDKWIRT